MIADCDAINDFKNIFSNGQTRPRALETPNRLLKPQRQ